MPYSFQSGIWGGGGHTLWRVAIDIMPQTWCRAQPQNQWWSMPLHSLNLFPNAVKHVLVLACPPPCGWAHPLVWASQLGGFEQGSEQINGHKRQRLPSSSSAEGRTGGGGKKLLLLQTDCTEASCPLPFPALTKSMAGSLSALPSICFKWAEAVPAGNPSCITSVHWKQKRSAAGRWHVVRGEAMGFSQSSRCFVSNWEEAIWNVGSFPPPFPCSLNSSTAQETADAILLLQHAPSKSKEEPTVAGWVRQWTDGLGLVCSWPSKDATPCDPFWSPHSEAGPARSPFQH